MSDSYEKALAILNFLNFDTKLPAVKEDAEEIAKIINGEPQSAEIASAIFESEQDLAEYCEICGSDNSEDCVTNHPLI